MMGPESRHRWETEGQTRMGNARELGSPVALRQVRGALPRLLQASARQDVRDPEQARRFLERVGADLQRGGCLDPAAGRVALREIAEGWLATTLHLRPKTRVDYECADRARAARPRRRARRPLDQPAVRRYVADLADPACPASSPTRSPGGWRARRHPGLREDATRSLVEQVVRLIGIDAWGLDRALDGWSTRLARATPRRPDGALLLRASQSAWVHARRSLVNMRDTAHSSVPYHGS